MFRGAVVLWTLLLTAGALAAPTVDELRSEVYRNVLNRRDDRALPVAKALVAATEKEFGPEHLEMAASLDTLGDRWAALQVHAEAEDSYRRALAIREKVLGPNHSEVAVSLLTISYPLEATDRHDEAYRLCRRALSILGKAKGHDHTATAAALTRMRAINMAQGKTVEAGILYERERAIREQSEKEEPLDLPIQAAPEAKQVTSSLSGERLWSCHGSLASWCFSSRDYDMALFHAVQAARLRPDISETHHNIGVVLAVSGSYAEAVKAHAEAWRLQPDVPMFRFHLARELANATRFAESEDHLRALLADDQDNPLYLNFMGVAVFRAGRRTEGMAMFRRALELAPDLQDAKGALAIALAEADEFTQKGARLRDAGREREAFANLATALEIEPDHSEALVIRGQMFVARGDSERSLTDIERAIKNHTRRPEAFSLRAHLRANKVSAEEQLNDLTRAVELGPDCFSYPLNRGIFHAGRGNWDLAYSDFATAHELAPGEPEPLANLAGARINRGCIDTALEACQQVLDRQPSHPLALYNRGVAFAHLGRLDESLRDLLEAKRLDPKRAAEVDGMIARFRLERPSSGDAQ